MKPDFGLRVALAVLFAFSRSGERERYDRFWRILTETFPSAQNDTQRNIFRSNEANASFEWISRDVGAPGDVDYRSQIAEALHGPPPHPKVTLDAAVRWKPGPAEADEQTGVTEG